MSHKACSIPLIAALTTEPPGKREPAYIRFHSPSMSRGSRPISQPSKSRTTSTVALSGPHEYASPMPWIPSSVCTFTNGQLRLETLTSRVSIFVIFIAALLPCDNERPEAHMRRRNATPRSYAALYMCVLYRSEARAYNHGVLVLHDLSQPPRSGPVAWVYRATGVGDTGFQFLAFVQRGWCADFFP